MTDRHRVADDKVHKRDVFHLWMTDGLGFSPTWDMPELRAVEARPEGLVPFSVAMGERCRDFGKFVHFYEDDFRFERVWSDPGKYLPKLRRFAGVVEPDFSTCPEFPRPLKMWSVYRSRLLAAWLQEQGLLCIPNPHWAPGCEWMLEGEPRRSVIAVCGRGVVKDIGNRRRFVRDLREIVDALEPTGIVYYGSDLYRVMDYPRSLGIPVWVHEGEGRGGLKNGELRGGEAHGRR